MGQIVILVLFERMTHNIRAVHFSDTYQYDIKHGVGRVVRTVFSNFIFNVFCYRSSKLLVL